MAGDREGRAEDVRRLRAEVRVMRPTRGPRAVPRRPAAGAVATRALYGAVGPRRLPNPACSQPWDAKGWGWLQGMARRAPYEHPPRSNPKPNQPQPSPLESRSLPPHLPTSHQKPATPPASRSQPASPPHSLTQARPHPPSDRYTVGGCALTVARPCRRRHTHPLSPAQRAISWPCGGAPAISWPCGGAPPPPPLLLPSKVRLHGQRQPQQ